MRETRKDTCRSKIPNTADPNLDANSPFSDKIWRTKAEEDKDNAAAMTIASSTLRMAANRGLAWKMSTKILVPMPLPTGRAKTVNAAVVATIVVVPSPNAYFARACTSI